MMDWSELTLFLYVTARMSGMVLFNPILGRQNLPSLVRSGFVLVLAVSVAPTVDQSIRMPAGTLEFMLRILLELALGMAFGMVMQFFFFIPQMAGEIVDTQMGLTMNQIYDASSQTNMSVTGVAMNILMILLFFAANGHHTLLRIIMSSGEIVPYGEVVLNTRMAEAALNLFCQCVLMGVKLAMPILAAELVGQFGMGILMKVIPQINVFAINIELKVIVGEVLLLLLIAPFGEYLLRVEATMLTRLEEFLQLAAG